MNEWVWSIGGMVLTGENWSTGREALYSVGCRWMNGCGALVEWYWQGKSRYWERNRSRCHFAQRRSHMDWLRTGNRGERSWCYLHITECMKLMGFWCRLVWYIAKYLILKFMVVKTSNANSKLGYVYLLVTNCEQSVNEQYWLVVRWYSGLCPDGLRKPVMNTSRQLMWTPQVVNMSQKHRPYGTVGRCTSYGRAGLLPHPSSCTCGCLQNCSSYWG